MQRLKLFIPLAIFAVLAMLFWRGLSIDPTAMPSALIDKPVPKFSLPALREPAKGQPEAPLTESLFIGRVSLLNVWATWCPTCYAEHQYLNELSSDGVKIIGLNYKDQRDKAVQWLTELGNPYLISLFDGDGMLGLDLGVYGAPETYIIDSLTLRGISATKSCCDYTSIIAIYCWCKTLKSIP